MKTTLVFRGDWIENEFQLQKVPLDHQIEFQNLFHAVTFCPPDRLVCFANNRSIPSLFSATFLKDPTEPEEQKYLLFILRTAFSRLRWFLIGMGGGGRVIFRDSNTSLHKHG